MKRRSVAPATLCRPLSDQLPTRQPVGAVGILRLLAAPKTMP
jgi:hypothetical protein